MPQISDIKKLVEAAKKTASADAATPASEKPSDAPPVAAPTPEAEIEAKAKELARQNEIADLRKRLAELGADAPPPVAADPTPGEEQNFRVELKDVPPRVFAAFDRHEAIQKYMQYAGILATVHEFGVRVATAPEIAEQHAADTRHKRDMERLKELEKGQPGDAKPS